MTDTKQRKYVPKITSPHGNDLYIIDMALADESSLRELSPQYTISLK